MAVRYRLDRTWRRTGDGRAVVAGSPLRLFRLTEGGAHVVARVEAGETPDSAAVQQLIGRFVDAGALHPEFDSSPYSPDDVTVVVPCFGGRPPNVSGKRIIVDDASQPPLVLEPHAVDTVGEQLVRREVNGGPGAARNTGLAHVTTPLVAFVDRDVVLCDGWLDALLPHFTDPRVALAAPRVRATEGTSWIDRYEHRHSPLDLGGEPARIAPGTRVSYVPAAAMLCRADAVRSIGGFDESLRLGEDVDLVWRLIEAGHTCRYEPASVVHHQSRPTLGDLLRQRMGYGSSAAPLATRHPGALAPVRTSAWSLAVALLVIARRPVTAAVVAAGTVAALQRRLRDVPLPLTARLVLTGHLAAGRQLAQATRRVWWPLVLPLLAGRRLRPWVLAAMAAPTLVDDLAYGAGVWKGMLAERNVGPLVPEFSGWPPRGGR